MTDRYISMIIWYVLFYYFHSCQNTRVQSGTLGIKNHILGSMPNTSPPIYGRNTPSPQTGVVKHLILSNGISLLVSYQLRLRHFSTGAKTWGWPQQKLGAIADFILKKPEYFHFAFVGPLYKTIQILLHCLVK